MVQYVLRFCWSGTKNLRHLSDHKPEGRKVVGSAIWESRRLQDLRLKLAKKGVQASQGRFMDLDGKKCDFAERLNLQ